MIFINTSDRIVTPITGAQTGEEYAQSTEAKHLVLLFNLALEANIYTSENRRGFAIRRYEEQLKLHESTTRQFGEIRRQLICPIGGNRPRPIGAQTRISQFVA